MAFTLKEQKVISNSPYLVERMELTVTADADTGSSNALSLALEPDEVYSQLIDESGATDIGTLLAKYNSSTNKLDFTFRAENTPTLATLTYRVYAKHYPQAKGGIS